LMEYRLNMIFHPHPPIVNQKKFFVYIITACLESTQYFAIFCLGKPTQPSE
jgi:hypothetical protein